MNLISSALDNYGTHTGLVLKYLGTDGQLQTAAPTIKKLGSAVMFGLVLSATTMDVPSYIRPQGAQRSAFNRTHDFGLGGFNKRCEHRFGQWWPIHLFSICACSFVLNEAA